MEEEVAYAERVAEFETQPLLLQIERQVLVLKVEGVQVELQCHHYNHVGFA